MSTSDVAFDPSPSTTGVGLTAAFGTVAVAAASTVPVAAFLAIAGVVGAIAGVRWAERRLVTTGALVAFAAALLAGAFGAPVATVLVSAAAAVLAWDVGTNAIEVGRQLGVHAPTARIELVHALASVLFATLVGAVAVAVYRVARGDQPTTTAVAALLVAAILFAWLLER